MKKLKGIIPVIQTFFDERGNIDELSTIKHINYLTKLKVGGFWILGTGSEDMNIIFSKRIKIAETLSNAKIKKPTVLGCSFYSMEEIFQFIKETGHLKFDAYHLMPYHPLLSLKQLTYLYEKVADLTMSKFGKPLWLYSSANWSRKIDFNFIKNLSKKDGICGIKYSTSNSPDQVKALHLNTKKFQVITAVMRQVFPSLMSGGEAFTSSLGGAIPEPIIKLYNSFEKKNYKKTLFYQRRINSFLDTLPPNLKKDNFLSSAEEKYILKIRGVGNGLVSNYYRAPTLSEKKIIKKSILKLYKDLGISKKFKIYS